MNAENLSERRYGRLVVLERDVSAAFDKPRWICLCDCGVRRSVRASLLKGGGTRSCGCLARQLTKERSVHGRCGSRTYNSWKAMIARCERDARNTRYFGKVAVCSRWHVFANFLVDMGERPEGHSIDRVDNGKGYEPGNCRWATPTQQTANRTLPTKSVLAENARRRNVRGERHTSAKLTEKSVVEVFELRALGYGLSEIGDGFGVTKTTVWSLLRRRSWSHVAIDPTLEAAVSRRPSLRALTLDTGAWATEQEGR